MFAIIAILIYRYERETQMQTRIQRDNEAAVAASTATATVRCPVREAGSKGGPSPAGGNVQSLRGGESPRQSTVISKRSTSTSTSTSFNDPAIAHR